MPLRSKSIEAGLGVLRKRVPENVVEKAMGKAATELLHDAVLTLPTTPILTGYLRGSGAVHVNGKFLTDAISEGIAPIDGHPNRDSFPSETGVATGTVSFNAEYATVQHELIGPRSEPSAGPKYLETPMLHNTNKYNKTIGDEIKKALIKALGR